MFNQILLARIYMSFRAERTILLKDLKI